MKFECECSIAILLAFCVLHAGNIAPKCSIAALLALEHLVWLYTSNLLDLNSHSPDSSGLRFIVEMVHNKTRNVFLAILVVQLIYYSIKLKVYYSI